MKTTIIGLLTAAAYAIQSSVLAGGSLLDWKSWIVPVGISLLGFHAQDAKKRK